MKVKLTRMETLDACDFLSTINLKGADESLARRIILAQVMLDAEARKIRAEDELISSRLISTDEEKEACKMLAKSYGEMLSSAKGRILDPAKVQEYQKAKARVEPIEKAIDKAREELERKYNPKFNIDPFTMTELVAHFGKIGVDYNLQTFAPIRKLIKG